MNKQNRDARRTVAQNDENVIDCSFAELPPAPEPVDPPVIYIVQCADEPEGKIHAHGDFTVDGAHLANGALALLDADGHAVATPTDVVPTDARISARLDYDGDVSLVKTVKVTTPGGTATMNVRVLA